MQLLENRSVIIIEGEQRKEFLQGLITNDIHKCPIYSLMLSPVGKFLYDFFIIEDQDQLLIDCDYLSLESLVKTLNLYKLRKKINIISKKDELGVFSSKEIYNEGICYLDPRSKELGYRIIAPKNTQITNSDHNYELMRLNLGIPEGHKDLIESKSFPLEFAMDRLNAIDFDKGCYVGQEVTSRTKYRGTIRKEIFIIRGEELPHTGDDIIVDQIKIGVMCSQLNNVGLALIKLEEYQKLDQTKLNFSLFKII
ncbi:tRNA-modifying protein YgfZ [Candidatus Arcanobacter lacustris]|uniref:tRNA-modifying protein YgfZ n=1 Tax=Candidatus Arcanibacter lacustris TaxID=1607817 RepID=A0A0F5MQE6_9RICK|nr:tRNA-modifying protein YgfZ [Candidatus Arcanobacter lacustris]